MVKPDDEPSGDTHVEDSAVEWQGPSMQVMSKMADRQPSTVGRYRLLSTIGQGAMGTVHRAHDPDLEREVAVKLVRGASTEQARARLLREARALARFGHPNIIQVFDVGLEDGLMYVVMEYRPGVNLRRWLDQDDRDWRSVLDVFVQAGHGLKAMHAVGLGHRDFKPHNVLLSEDGVARVLDFGLAKAFESSRLPAFGSGPVDLDESTATEVTRQGVVLGTPAYMAPELWCKMPAEPRTDQFGYCVALYEALYGRRPFAGQDLKELGRNIVRGNMLEPPEDADVPARFWPLLRKGMSRFPKQRHASMYALVRALERARRREEVLLEAAIMRGERPEEA
jgi:serine/threonine protein kinase